jgi:signal transduction histidine kinase/response regulator of citrate/malate metabolism
MQPKLIKYYLLCLFIAGLVLFIVLQFNSARNIRTLISGNEKLLDELNVKNELQKLQTNIARTDSKVRGTLISQDTLNITGIEAEVAVIRADLQEINKMVLNDSTEKLLTQLNYLVDEKNQFNIAVLDTFYSKGKWPAERMINAQKGKRLGEAITAILHLLDSTRQTEVNRTTHLIDSSGQKALNWGTVMLFFACLSSLISFLYITSRIYKQEQLIDALDESRRKEKKLTAVKDQFLANMSHEIRTPMNAVLGFTHLLQQQPMNEKSREYVAAIQQAGDNLLAIINDILDISKIESGMMRLEPVSFSLRGMLHSLQRMFLPKAAEKDLELSVHIDAQVPDILYGDAIRLNQILVNLINNAIKFTHQGNVRVDVAREEHDEPAIRLLFTVTDTGIGIAPDKLSSIFDRFNQAEADITRRFGGTGLGLTIVKQLVALQHGSIRVESEPGKGSKFVVTLPYTPGQLSPEGGDNYDYFQEHIALPQQPEVRLLVAEDNRMNQNLLRHLLGKKQFHYQLAGNGQEALAALSRQHFDLVLMDIQMPEMDGYTATRKIRSELQSNIPIIAMTAHAMSGEREKCLQAGMNEYLAKPIKEEELYRMIQVFTGKSSTPGLYAHHKGTNGHVASQEGSLVQLAYLQQLSKGDKAFERSMLAQFITQLPDDLAVLEKAIDEGAVADIRSSAHTIKTTISFIGLESSLYPILESLENLNGDYDRTSVTNQFNTIKSLCTQALQETLLMML